MKLELPSICASLLVVACCNRVDPGSEGKPDDRYSTSCTLEITLKQLDRESLYAVARGSITLYEWADNDSGELAGKWSLQEVDKKGGIKLPVGSGDLSYRRGDSGSVAINLQPDLVDHNIEMTIQVTDNCQFTGGTWDFITDAGVTATGIVSD